MTPGGIERLFPNTEKVINYVLPLREMIFNLREKLEGKKLYMPEDFVILGYLFRVFHETIKNVVIKDYSFVCETLRVPISNKSNRMSIYYMAESKWYGTKGAISIDRILLVMDYIYQNTDCVIKKEDYQIIRRKLKNAYGAKKFII